MLTFWEEKILKFLFVCRLSFFSRGAELNNVLEFHEHHLDQEILMNFLSICLLISFFSSKNWDILLLLSWLKMRKKSYMT